MRSSLHLTQRFQDMSLLQACSLRPDAGPPPGNHADALVVMDAVTVAIRGGLFVVTGAYGSGSVI